MLVGVDLGLPHFDVELEELAQLAETAGYRVVDRVACKRRAPDPALFIGSGKADEIKALALGHGATEILFDQALSPSQQRNLERHMGLPVNDRTLLILEIFAQRARSHEGKLQVELARLQYLSTRLVRRWSHLERQSGGIGMRGGPGETQIELDRRMIGDRIKQVKERLEKVKRQRGTQRRQRGPYCGQTAFRGGEQAVVRPGQIAENWQTPRLSKRGIRGLNLNQRQITVEVCTGPVMQKQHHVALILPRPDHRIFHTDVGLNIIEG